MSVMTISLQKQLKKMNFLSGVSLGNSRVKFTLIYSSSVQWNIWNLHKRFPMGSCNILPNFK